VRDEREHGADDDIWRVTADDVELIAGGAVVLGSGGGGDPYLGQVMAAKVVREGRPCRVIPLESLGDDDMVMAVGQMGAATVFAERLARGHEAALAITAIEQQTGVRAKALLCYEIGGINSVLTLAVAAELGLPLVDGDLMGRAFPELQMTTLDIGGAPAAPLAVCDDRGAIALIAAAENMLWTERLARALLTAMGGIAYIARPVMRAADLKHLAVRGSYTRARALGVALRQARNEGTPVDAALVSEGAYLALRGTVAAVERPTIGGTAQGSIAIHTLGRVGAAASIDFQTEYLIVSKGAETLATVPDIICVIDEETGAVVTTDAVQVGLRIVVLVLPADPKLITPAALRLLGPRAFGYDAPYRARGPLLSSGV